MHKDCFGCFVNNGMQGTGCEATLLPMNLRPSNLFCSNDLSLCGCMQQRRSTNGTNIVLPWQAMVVRVMLLVLLSC